MAPKHLLQLLLPAVVVSALFGAGQASASPSALRVLVISTLDGQPTTFQSQIAAQPGVAAVDLFNGSAGTPSPAVLGTYDLVVAMSDSDYNDSTALGNELADFVDAGGVVFEYAYDNWAGNDPAGALRVAPQGRWASGAYGTYIAGDNPNVPLTLGVFDATNPLMQGVTSLAAAFNTTPTLAPGATRVAKWSDGTEMLAYKGRVVGSSANLDEDDMPFSGDWGKLTTNAVRWLGRHTLSVSKSGSGSGTIASAPAGINCGLACAADYAYITPVTLTATAADANQKFTGWTGDCSGTAATCVVSVDRARTVGASFAKVGGAAKLRIASRTVSISLRSGSGRLGVRCTNLATDSCKLALSLRATVKAGHSTLAKTRRVGAGKGTIKGGKRGSVELKLTRRGRAMLAHAKGLKLKVRLTGRSTNRAGQANKVSGRLVLKGKSRR
jgi:hypothetical protein